MTQYRHCTGAVTSIALEIVHRRRTMKMGYATTRGVAHRCIFTSNFIRGTDENSGLRFAKFRVNFESGTFRTTVIINVTINVGGHGGQFLQTVLRMGIGNNFYTQ